MQIPLRPAKGLASKISAVFSGLPESETAAEDPGVRLAASSVLVPVGVDSRGDACLVFNKRSGKVRQPGDLCFPGGSPEPGIDALLAMLLYLPGSPLSRWPHFRHWRNGGSANLRKLARMLGTGLRESFEEMRLNPLPVHFLGPMPPQYLVMFRRVIHPMVVWVPGSPKFRPNWEVDRIVRIRLQDLLDPAGYRKYHITYSPGVARETGSPGLQLPAYRHRDRHGTEILWGATYRITATFLHAVFGFEPPPEADLPVVRRILDRSYYAGRPS